MSEGKRCTLMFTDFHGRYKEGSVGNGTVGGEGSVDWLGIGTARWNFMV